MHPLDAGVVSLGASQNSPLTGVAPGAWAILSRYLISIDEAKPGKSLDNASEPMQNTAYVKTGGRHAKRLRSRVPMHSASDDIAIRWAGALDPGEGDPEGSSRRN